MGQKFDALSDRLIEFIRQQHLFFVGTATKDSRVNISPKGMDSLRVMNANRILWLNVTGSGNETATHIEQNPRMTIMFAAFTGKPMILRLYGTATAVHHNDPEWQRLYPLFDPLPGARQIFILDIDLVQTSCGMAVPLYEYAGDREQLNNWAEKKGQAGIEEYWREKNVLSIDGDASGIIEKNLR
jgi:hypothetical protein